MNGEPPPPVSRMTMAIVTASNIYAPRAVSVVYFLIFVPKKYEASATTIVSAAKAAAVVLIMSAEPARISAIKAHK